jgi:hypothetical protein
MACHCAISRRSWERIERRARRKSAYVSISNEWFVNSKIGGVEMQVVMLGRGRDHGNGPQSSPTYRRPGGLFYEKRNEASKKRLAKDFWRGAFSKRLLARSD